MARQGIQETQVFQTAETLINGHNREPTVQAIREKLGAGSYVTISKHLKKWREIRAKESTPPTPNEILALTRQIWVKACQDATTSLDEKKQAFNVEKENWNYEREKMLQEIDKLEVQEATSSNKMAKLEARIKEDKEANRKRSQDYQAIKEKLVKLETQLESSEERRKEALSRANKLEKELTNIAKNKRITKKT